MAGAGEKPRISRRRLVTLKCRKDFQTVRKGSRWAARAFVLEGRQRPRPASDAVSCEARFGFTVTRAMGGAVERNRIRRRLKAAVDSVQAAHARRDFDYVVIARRAALDSKFDELVRELVKALDRVHRPPGASRSGPHREAVRKES